MGLGLESSLSRQHLHNLAGKTGRFYSSLRRVLSQGGQEPRGMFSLGLDSRGAIITIC